MINANSFLISLRIILSAVQIYKKSTAEAMDHISQWPLLLPPVLAVVEHDAFALLSVLLLEERNLIAYAKLYKLTDMHMCLSQCLQIDIIADAILDTKTYVVECLINTRRL
jgi:hypothetical protein